MERVEFEPSLPPELLPKDKRVPYDQSLRAASAEEVIGGFRALLQRHYPTTLRKVHLLRSEVQFERLQKRWRTLGLEAGFPKELLELNLRALREARAAHFLQEVALLPPVLAELDSLSVWNRLLAARTFTHEWWHVMGSSISRKFYPFEEGSAEVFAERAILRFTGADTVAQRRYEALGTAVQALYEALGEDWLLESRHADDTRVWLGSSLESYGVPTQELAELLLYTRDERAWLVRIVRGLEARDARQNTF